MDFDSIRLLLFWANENIEGRNKDLMNGQIFKKYKGLITGIVIALFAIAYLIGSLFIKRTKFVSIGADFMPKIYGTVLLLLAACQVYQGFLEAKQFVTATEKNEVKQKDTKNVLLTFILIVSYVALMELLGFVVSSMIFLFLMSLLLTPKNMKHNYIVTIIFSVILPLGAYLFFRKIMHLSLPIGIIFGK